MPAPSCLAVWQHERHDARPLEPGAFTDLVEVDATNVSAETAVGRVTAAARRSLGDRGVVEALIRADIVRIWAHIEGEVCLVAEASAEGAYTARFTGHHVYYTNERNEAPLAFEVRIAPDGAIVVAP